MPDFVLKALNQCLPSKEQEESILSAPDPPCSNTLEIPPTGFVEPNHFLMRNNHPGSRSPEQGKVIILYLPFLQRCVLVTRCRIKVIYLKYQVLGFCIGKNTSGCILAQVGLVIVTFEL